MWSVADEGLDTARGTSSETHRDFPLLMAQLNVYESENPGRNVSDLSGFDPYTSSMISLGFTRRGIRSFSVGNANQAAGGL